MSVGGKQFYIAVEQRNSPPDGNWELQGHLCCCKGARQGMEITALLYFWRLLISLTKIYFITFTILKSVVQQLESVLLWGGFCYDLHILRSTVKEIHSVEYHW